MKRIVQYFVNIFNNNQNEKLLNNINNYNKKELEKQHSKTYSFFTEEIKKNNTNF